eukprot:TRINITY_DN32180_c0_g1_i1.p1 TRINITY_DN32180_c0_g1~~TRINITY_DN32180_c0_g1_i1.p1  ORF type:complete len:559 (-),score=109.73 TRINITY_DN32180_c0_g1_i1:307-1926(-)
MAVGSLRHGCVRVLAGSRHGGLRLSRPGLLHGSIARTPAWLTSCRFNATGGADEAASSTKEADTGAKTETPESNDSSEKVCMARLGKDIAKGAGQAPDSKPLSKVQSGCLGGLGAVLTLAGAGGYAWLNWPLMGLNGLCVAVAGAGVCMSAAAARLAMPPREKPAKPPKPLLELKLLNDDFLLKGEHDSLTKLTTSKKLPADVQAALAAAEKIEAKTKEASAAELKKKLLGEVKKELDAGASTDEVKQRLRPKVFVFDWKPPADAAMAARPQAVKTQIELLRSSVNFILSAASKHDQALLRLTSPGGGVSEYGLAASQLQRLRSAGIPLTVCVDTVAASGGYMMACVADHVVSAPFAMLGSIGVIAGAPNFSKILEKNEVEIVQRTGGKYKSTLNILTPNTEEGLAKFQQDIDNIHVAFKAHVSEWRPQIDIEEVATGEVWIGRDALDRGLVDALGTSDDHIRQKVSEGCDAVEIVRAKQQEGGLAAKLKDALGGAGASFAEGAVVRGSHAVTMAWGRLTSGRPAEPPRVEATEFREVK